jgi:dipeptidyl-peptidase-4
MIYRTIFLGFALCSLLLPSARSQTLLTNDIIWGSGQLRHSTPGNFSFLKNSQYYTKLQQKELEVYDIETGERSESVFTRTELENMGYRGPNFQDYSFSPNEKKVLLSTETEKIYRYSKKGFYYVFDRETRDIQPLDTLAKQLYPTFDPSGQKVAFVMENNLYVKDLTSGNLTAITENGEWNKIICGAADWVYEEELKLTRAFEWSPDGNSIAYVEFNESEVPEFSMKFYRNDPYPEKYSFKYPKVGETNSKVQVFLVDLATKDKMSMDIPEGWRDFYIPRLYWMPGTNELIVSYLNRLQNHLILKAYDPKTSTYRKLLEEKNRYYISIHDDLIFLPQKKQWIWASEREGWNQLFLYNYEGELLGNLTKGSYDVTDCYGVDPESERLFYQAATRTPMDREVLSVSLKTRKVDTLLKLPGWNSATFSSDFNYFISRHATINTPPVYHVQHTNEDASRLLIDNERTKKMKDKFNAQPIEFATIASSDSVNLNAFFLYPPDFDSTQQYPVLMHVYGGPNSQQVVNNWKGSYYWWFQMLAQKGFIVASVDNRGTGARGENFRKLTYKKLGLYESEDQIEAARILSSQSHVDPDNISIFGWSYGGYLSSLALLKGDDVFSAAIAVAPVTNWKWYDSIYTERFMQTYRQNEEGYDTNAPIFYVDRLKGRYLLVHGLADDNVHFQHTAEMSNALIQANKQFDTYLYPNRNHGIYGDNARRHLFNKITRFLEQK